MAALEQAHTFPFVAALPDCQNLYILKIHPIFTQKNGSDVPDNAFMRADAGEGLRGPGGVFADDWEE